MQAYRKSVISAFSEVENALVSLQQQTSRERLQAEAVKSSHEAFNISEARLRGGTVPKTSISFSPPRQSQLVMTALRLGTSPPPVRMLVRFFATPTPIDMPS